MASLDFRCATPPPHGASTSPPPSMELWLQAPSRSGSDLGAARRGLASLLEAPSPSLRSCGSILCSARYHTRSREIARDDTTSRIHYFDITRDPLRSTQNRTQDITTHRGPGGDELTAAALRVWRHRTDKTRGGKCWRCAIKRRKVEGKFQGGRARGASFEVCASYRGRQEGAVDGQQLTARPPRRAPACTPHSPPPYPPAWTGSP